MTSGTFDIGSSGPDTRPIAIFFGVFVYKDTRDILDYMKKFKGPSHFALCNIQGCRQGSSGQL